MDIISPEAETADGDLRRASIDLLARREHSCVELRRKLGRKFQSRYSVEEIDNVIETLAAEGLQSDLRFAESYARARYEKGDGPYKIKAALQERGIHAGLVERVLGDEQFDWQRRAKLLYQRKFAIQARLRQRPGQYDEDELKQRAREIRFLQSRGFPKEVIYSVLA